MKWAAILFVFIGLAGCNSQESGGGSGTKGSQVAEIVNQYPVYDLTDQQKVDLQYMWEEEKLARDVYLYLLDIWGVKIFSNISSSEQQHMDAVASLLTKYGIPQNVDGSNRGAYSFEEIRQLYVGLTQQGSLSEREAYLVGKGIEELDIDDLKARLNTAQPDAQEVFSRLLDASYRHLSAFNSKL